MRIAICAILLAAHAAVSQPAFEIWSDPDATPRLDEIVFLELPLDKTGGDNAHHIGSPDVLEKDGLAYKTVQLFDDAEFDVEVPAGRYLNGLLGGFWPRGTVDGRAWLATTRLTAQIDDTEFPLTQDDIQFLEDVPTVGFDLTAYNFYPRFLEPGEYTLKYRWTQVEPFFYVFPFGAPLFEPATDPLAGFEGRRVFLPEHEGATLDGEMVLTYNVTVVAATAVSPTGWADIKQRARTSLR